MAIDYRNFYAVAGFPISHSVSPDYFKKLNYSRISSFSADEAIDIFHSLKLRALNVTAPLKEKIVNYTDERDEIVKNLNVANLLVRDLKIKSYNTDCVALEKLIEPYKEKISKSNACVCGAGGAARAIISILKKYSCNITIFNRNIERANLLAKTMGCDAKSLDEINQYIKNYKVVAWALPPDVTLNITELPKDVLVVDSNYYKSGLLKLLQSNNPYISGLDWFNGQASETAKILKIASKNKLNEAVFTKIKNISLIGFMGAGKTSIAMALARKLNFDFTDTDTMVEKETGKTIYSIFEQDGEKYFRKLENEILSGVMKKSGQIISCGGGILNSENNYNLLKENSFRIWLYTSFEKSFARVKGTDRPLIRSKEIARRLYMGRRNTYFKASDIIVNTNFRNLESIVDQIYEEVCNKI